MRIPCRPVSVLDWSLWDGNRDITFRWLFLRCDGDTKNKLAPWKTVIILSEDSVDWKDNTRLEIQKNAMMVGFNLTAGLKVTRNWLNVPPRQALRGSMITMIKQTWAPLPLFVFNLLLGQILRKLHSSSQESKSVSWFTRKFAVKVTQ